MYVDYLLQFSITDGKSVSSCVNAGVIFETLTHPHANYFVGVGRAETFKNTLPK